MVVAVVSALACLLALVGAILWPMLNETQQRIALGVTTWWACWTVLGSVSLVHLTVWHDTRRAELMQTIEQARELRQRTAGVARPRTRA